MSKKNKPTATKIAQLSPVDAVVYGFAMGWLTDREHGHSDTAVRLYVDEHVNVAIRRCLPLNFNPMNSLQRIVSIGLLMYVVEGGQPSYFRIP